MLMLWRSILARPLTTLYVLASVVIVFTSAGRIDRGVALIFVSFMFFILMTLGLHRENRISARRVEMELDAIHVMVNSQHTELVERVADLIRALQDAGVAVPAPKGKDTP